MKTLAALLILAAAASAQGITWEQDLNATLARARRENRPILIAVNAIAGEAGNEQSRRSVYRNAMLGKTTEPMLCLVANPDNHMKGGKCSRYGSGDCKTHKDVLAYALRRWSRTGDMISPQHLVLAPDGKLLWRQEYLIQAGPLQRQCEIALVKTAPDAALKLVGRTRRKIMASLEGGMSPKAYVSLGDPLAPAVLLSMWEDDEEDKWLEALKSSSPDAFGLIRLYLEDEERFLPVARAIDPKKGAWWAKRFRMKAAKAPPPHDAKLRKAFVALKKGDTSGLDKLLAALSHPVDGPEVRAALIQLAGVDLGPSPDGWREQFGK